MAANQAHNAGMWVFPRAAEVSGDMAAKSRAMPRPIVAAITVSAILLVLGIVGFVARAVDDGFTDHAPWGYYAAIFSFLLMVTGSAPLVALVFRFTKSHWRRPLSRASELFALVGILNLLMFIPLMFVLPAINNPGAGEEAMELRRTIWFEVPIGAPHWWDALGVGFLAVLGLAILWLASVPDLAEARLTSGGLRRKFYNLMAGHWFGTKRQWEMQKAGLAVLGAFYFMFLIWVHFIISTDYGQSLIPGWKDSIFPVLYSLTGLQASLGLILVIMFIMRRWGGYQEYIGISLFWSASKILLGLSMLWVYHVFSFMITYWYGRLDVEQDILKYLFTQSYGWMFAANFFFSFVMPFLLLLWNPVRKTDWGPALAGVAVLIGALLFNLRIFVGAFNAGDVYRHALNGVPPAVWPDIWDIFMVIGGLGAAALIYLTGTRFFPLISVWEIKEGAMYQRMGTFMRGEYLILAKPE